MIPEKFYEILADSRNVLLLSHTPLDGDAAGALLAMRKILFKQGKQVTVVNDHPVPGLYNYLPDADQIEIYNPNTPYMDFDLGIVIDTARYNTMGLSQKLLKYAGRVINLDHHGDTPEIGEEQFIYPEASASCELVYEIAEHLDYPFESNFDECVYTGLLTDTKSFMQMNTTARSLLIASEIVARGLKPYNFVEKIYESRRLEDVRLMGEILATLSHPSGESFVWMIFRQAMATRTGGRLQDLEGVIDHARSIRGAKVSVFFKEKNENEYKISLRAKGEVDVKKFVSRYDGGGHRAASGCTLRGNIEEVRERVISDLKKYLQEEYPGL